MAEISAALVAGAAIGRDAIFRDRFMRRGRDLNLTAHGSSRLDPYINRLRYDAREVDILQANLPIETDLADAVQVPCERREPFIIIDPRI